MEQYNIPEAFCSKLRLSILSSLVSRELYYTDMKKITSATDGNISIQLKKLLNWGYVEAEKKIRNDRLATLYRITPKGLKEFELYVEFLEGILRRD